MPHMKQNVGFVFTKMELLHVRDLLLSNKVKVPAQTTTLGPEKTSFFQALAIPTKITKGTIEILNEVSLIKAGDKVGQSESTLLNMLNISPFAYGLIIENVYDSGSLFSPSILDITDDDILARFMEGVRNVPSVSLSIGYPTVASAPHSIINGFKNLLAISVETDYTFPEAEQTKEFLKDPSKFASAVAAAAPAAADKKADAPAAPAAKEESEESDEDMGFGLFD